MSGALHEPYPPVPEPWSSWRDERLLGKINALMVDAGFFRSVSTDMRGKSGILHHFTMMYFDRDSLMAVDVYDRASAVEVIQTYVKALDIHSRARIVTANEPTALALELAEKYRVALDTASDVEELYAATFDEPRLAS